MKSKSKLTILSTAFGLFVCSILFSQDAKATTPTLWWSATEINTNSVSDCATFGGSVLKNSNAKSVETSDWTASGQVGDTSIIIGCIGTSPKVTALIMAIGQNGNNTTNSHNVVLGKVAAYPTVPPIGFVRRRKPVTPENSESQSPTYFYWKTFGVKTNTAKKCYELARPEFRKYSNFRETKDVELSASSGTSYVALKCFQTSSGATAVISVVGDDNTETKSLFETVSDKVSKREFID